MIALGAKARDRVGARVEGMDLAIDAALAHAPRDQLRHLAAEIEDEDAVGHGSSVIVSGIIVTGGMSRKSSPSGSGTAAAFAFRAITATKKPSVPWRAGVRRRIVADRAGQRRHGSRPDRGDRHEARNRRARRGRLRPGPRSPRAATSR